MNRAAPQFGIRDAKDSLSRLFGRPKSLLRLVLIGFALVSAPLILALGVAAWSVDRIADEGQVAVYEAIGVTQESARMARLATDMERAARQYLIFDDPTSLQDYRSWRRELAAAGGLPGSIGPAEADWIHRGVRIVEATLLATLLLKEQPEIDAHHNIHQLIMALHRSVGAVSSAGYERIDHEVEQMADFSAQAREVLIWHLLAAIPVTVIFSIYFSRRIHRPIYALGDSIRRLGASRFDEPVAVSGPRDLENLGSELDWLRRHLSDLQTQRQRFLRHISHELKTPLAAILEGTELLRDAQIAGNPGQSREIADIVRENGHELRRQIDNLLRFTRHGESASPEEEVKVIDIADLIREVADRHLLSAQRRSIEIDLDLEEQSLEADKRQLATVVDNLLANALRFSPDEGRISVTLKEKNDLIELCVSDQGEGITQQERQTIFEPFRQGETTGKGSVKGSGLGLSLVRECVTELGGQVSAQTAPEGGALLQVVLPKRELKHR
ncbi:putative sensor-like histidine kinase YfhK [Halorhodospira halochloris]|uniref:histidine kinase n=1 Tax=Halorhodospira halochloris TaxID=1052 RepID=A0A0X8X7H7_HALHR|nr:HAMP domain-containing sensor histidine kinase [Halorhodospira halochloris]BAU56403.1 putative sensor-like histidine kinase YfhK [Halorhodospira halochloris]